MIRKIAIGVSGLLGVLLLVTLAIYVSTMPEPPPRGSASEAWLSPGPFSVALDNRIFVDETRETAANGDAPRLPARTLPTNIWYPEDGTGNYPLIVHSHGFVSERSDMAYVAKLLASHGYIVVAANYPLTNGGAAGGPNANDLVNQPADVSFLIDSVLALAGSNKPFTGDIDASRIGLMGYSLGGITTTLATYHPRLRDDRVAAAVSIAGPSAGLTKKFYENSDVPFMMIAGNSDALIDFEYNAAIIPARVRNSILVEIEGGTHLGFGSISEPWLRLMKHPDGLGCSAVLSNADDDASAFISALGDESDGIDLNDDIPTVCENMPTTKALHPGRQQMITSIAVLSFFESVFNESPIRKEEALAQLSSTLASELPQASLSTATIPAGLRLQEF